MILSNNIAATSLTVIWDWDRIPLSRYVRTPAYLLSYFLRSPAWDYIRSFSLHCTKRAPAWDCIGSFLSTLYRKVTCLGLYWVIFLYIVQKGHLLGIILGYFLYIIQKGHLLRIKFNLGHYLYIIQKSHLLGIILGYFLYYIQVIFWAEKEHLFQILLGPSLYTERAPAWNYASHSILYRKGNYLGIMLCHSLYIKHKEHLLAIGIILRKSCKKTWIQLCMVYVNDRTIPYLM